MKKYILLGSYIHERKSEYTEKILTWSEVADLLNEKDEKIQDLETALEGLLRIIIGDFERKRRNEISGDVS